MSLTLLLLACAGGPDPTTEPTVHTADTSEPLPPACDREPCVTELDDAPWAPPAETRHAGNDLVRWDDSLFVGAPGLQGDGLWTPRAVMVELPSMQTGPSLLGQVPYDGTGHALAVGDVDDDGDADLAIGAFNEAANEYDGVAHLLEVPTGDVVVTDEARLSFRSPKRTYAGLSVALADVVDGGGAELIAGGSGEIGSGSIPEAPGRAYVVDSTLTGIVTEDDATVVIRGDRAGVGQRVAGWDANGDGASDLVTSLSDSAGVGWFAGPLTAGELSEADAAGTWTAPSGEHCRCLGDFMETIGDLDGDGLDDLTFSAPTWDATGPTRTGRVYVALAGDLQHGRADDLSIQVRGTEEGEGVGYDMASGDIDGDGNEDLVVGAPGVYPGTWPGKVLVFRGPVQGILSPDDADAVVYGERDGDQLGRALLVHDVDADGRDDVFASALGLDRDRGGLYLLAGDDLLP